MSQGPTNRDRKLVYGALLAAGALTLWPYTALILALVLALVAALVTTIRVFALR